MNPPPVDRLTFFLGGRDLEMATIRELLQARGARFIDHGLAWGARRSDYRREIAAELAAGRTPVLIELTDDSNSAAPHSGAPDSGRSTADDLLANVELLIVDHHGSLAGKSAPTALEQVFRLVGAPPSDWSRWFELVAANDRGHVRAMRAIGASSDEMRRVRAADRAAQGVTPAEEEAGRAAAAQATRLSHGRLTVVRSPHDRTSPVCDALDADLGGPGYDNLLVFGPRSTTFFGAGTTVSELARQFPDAYFGGELPERGFWGRSTACDADALIAQVLKALAESPADPAASPAVERSL